jgi:hypothetical protein
MGELGLRSRALTRGGTWEVLPIGQPSQVTSLTPALVATVRAAWFPT